MRTLALTLLMPLISFLSYADLGGCFKFKTKFVLADGSIIVGYYIEPSQNDLSYLTSLDSVIFAKLAHKDSIKIYRNLHLLENIVIDGTTQPYYVAYNKDIIKICIEDIIETFNIDCLPCCPPRPGSHYKYEFCCSPVVTQLSDNEIDKILSSKPKLSYNDFSCGNAIYSFIVISYSDTIKKSDIKDIIYNRYCLQYASNYSEIKYKELRSYLKDKDVIIFEICIDD